MIYRFSEETDTAVVKFLVDLAATLNLRNWTIGLSPDRPDEADGWDEGALAQIEPVPHRHLAVVKLCENFLHLPPKEMLLVLVHELCHLYCVGTKQGILDQFSIHSMSVAEYNQLQARLHHEEEMAVDLMSVAWADTMWEWASVQKRLKKILKTSTKENDNGR